MFKATKQGLYLVVCFPSPMVGGTMYNMPAAASREELDIRLYAVRNIPSCLREPSIAVGSSYVKGSELTEVFMTE